jgi:hypothetical protein
MIATPQQIEKAAAAIANQRGNRRGVPTIENVLALLPPQLRAEVIEDASAALNASGLPADFKTATDLLAAMVFGEQKIEDLTPLIEQSRSFLRLKVLPPEGKR